MELANGFFMGGDVSYAKREHGTTGVAAALESGFDAPPEIITAVWECGHFIFGAFVWPETTEDMKTFPSMGEFVSLEWNLVGPEKYRDDFWDLTRCWVHLD